MVDEKRFLLTNCRVHGGDQCSLAGKVFTELSETKRAGRSILKLRRAGMLSPQLSLVQVLSLQSSAARGFSQRSVDVLFLPLRVTFVGEIAGTNRGSNGGWLCSV